MKKKFVFYTLLLVGNIIGVYLYTHDEGITYTITDTAQNTTATLRSRYLTDAPFSIDTHAKAAQLMSYPTISCVDGSCLSSACLNKELNEILHTLIEKKHLPPDITILKDGDFNFNTAAGLIIFKLRNYPLVVKLFMETPQSLTKPFSKGLEAACLFIMNGGITRHLGGFTRISNRNNLMHIAQKTVNLVLPRIWLWTPKDRATLTITKQSDTTKELRVPATYALICDEVPPTAVPAPAKEAFTLFHALDQHIDPNKGNIVYDASSDTYFILDMEDFPTMVGLTEHMPCSGYFSWYWYLGKHFISRLINGMIPKKYNNAALNQTTVD